MPLPAPRSAPRNSIASAISSADREPAPSSSIAAVRLAMPNLPAGSSALPLRTTRLTCATGTSCSSTIHTGRPFDSCRFWIAGSFSAGGGPGCGGRARSGGCCATSVDASDRARRASARKARRHEATGHAAYSMLVATSSTLSSRLFLRHDGQLDAPSSGRNCARPRRGCRTATARDSAPGLR